MEMTLILTILGRLIPFLYERIRNGEEWRNIRLGDIEDWKSCEELERELRQSKP